MDAQPSKPETLESKKTPHISDLLNDLAANLGIDKQQLNEHLDQLKPQPQQDLQIQNEI